MCRGEPHKPQTVMGNLIDSLGFPSSVEIPDQIYARY
jgi:hypothetical protein